MLEFASWFGSVLASPYAYQYLMLVEVKTCAPSCPIIGILVQA